MWQGPGISEEKVTANLRHARASAPRNAPAGPTPNLNTNCHCTGGLQRTDRASRLMSTIPPTGHGAPRNQYISLGPTRIISMGEHTPKSGSQDIAGASSSPGLTIVLELAPAQGQLKPQLSATPAQSIRGTQLPYVQISGAQTKLLKRR